MVFRTIVAAAPVYGGSQARARQHFAVAREGCVACHSACRQAACELAHSASALKPLLLSLSKERSGDMRLFLDERLTLVRRTSVVTFGTLPSLTA